MFSSIKHQISTIFELQFYQVCEFVSLHIWWYFQKTEVSIEKTSRLVSCKFLSQNTSHHLSRHTSEKISQNISQSCRCQSCKCQGFSVLILYGFLSVWKLFRSDESKTTSLQACGHNEQMIIVLLCSVLMKLIDLIQYIDDIWIFR